MAVVLNDMMKWTADECDSCPYYECSQLLHMTGDGCLQVQLLSGDVDSVSSLFPDRKSPYRHGGASFTVASGRRDSSERYVCS